MRLNLGANQNYNNGSMKMVNWTILEPYCYPSGKYDHYFCSGKIVDWTDEELEQTSEAVGYGAVKYVLKCLVLERCIS